MSYQIGPCYMRIITSRYILNKVYVLIGITPLKTLKMAKYMNDAVPGVFIPARLMRRMETADQAGNAQEEGVQIALELIEKIKEFKEQGVNGLHIMAIGWEEIVPRIITEGGMLPDGFAKSELKKEKAPA